MNQTKRHFDANCFNHPRNALIGTILFLAMAACYGQTNTATLSGTVTDPKKCGDSWCDPNRGQGCHELRAKSDLQ
jgi:hypothetical protein